MDYKKVNKKSLFLGLSIIIIVGLVYTYRSDIVKKEGVYTIATVYNIEERGGGRRNDFSYSFKGKTYESYGMSPYIHMSDEGKRFFIQILTNDPSRCFMTRIRVPDSITEAPLEGWKELPIITTP